MYNFFYRYSDTIIATSVSLMLLIFISITGVLNYDVWSSKHPNINKEVTTAITPQVVSTPTQVKEDYVPPSSTLPKDIKQIYILLSDYNSKFSSFTIELQNDTILIHKSLNNKSTTFYLIYSKMYDCTVVKTDPKQDEPTQIFYHFEYKDADEFSRDVSDFINSYVVQPTDTVHLDKNDDGTLKIHID